MVPSEKILPISDQATRRCSRQSDRETQHQDSMFFSDPNVMKLNPDLMICRICLDMIIDAY